MMNTSYKLLTGMWPMSGPSWWLSYQRTKVPISAKPTATHAMREPKDSIASAWPRMKMPAQ